ncbi:MAG: V-type ATPase subunit [Oscillospiraceae bacterium]
MLGTANAIAGKARAIYGKRITPIQYAELLRLNSVSQVCSYLKQNTYYQTELKGIDEYTVYRGQLELLLQRSRIKRYISLCHYDFSGHFYNYVIKKIECEIILKAIMYIKLNTPQELITKIPMFIKEYTCLNFDAILKSATFSQLLDALKDTGYEECLKHFNTENETINYQGCELALKIFYYDEILKDINKNYSGKTRKELEEVILIEIELLNISLIYRLKYYLKKPKEEIMQMIIPHYYKLNKKQIDILLSDNCDIVSKLHQYNKTIRDVDFTYIEDYTKRLKHIVNKKTIRFSASPPVTFYALMTLMQIEIENLFIIIEGIKYEDNDIKRLLII